MRVAPYHLDCSEPVGNANGGKLPSNQGGSGQKTLPSEDPIFPGENSWKLRNQENNNQPEHLLGKFRLKIPMVGR